MKSRINLTFGIALIGVVALGACTKKETIFTEKDAQQMCTKMAECFEPHIRQMEEQMKQVPAEMRGMMPKMEMPKFDKESCLKKSNPETSTTKVEGRQLADEELRALKRCSDRIIASSCNELMAGGVMQSAECNDWMNISKNLAE